MTIKRQARYRLEVDDSYGCREVILRPTSQEGVDLIGSKPRQYRAIGGYVYDVTEKHGTLGQQVCIGMSSSGHTLMATNESLPRVIRRNVRLMMRQADMKWRDEE